MAILTDFKFKGMDVKSYLNFNNYIIQKQFEDDKKKFSITVELFFNTEKGDYLLESRPFSFVVDNLDGLTTESIYEKINTVYPGERV